MSNFYLFNFIKVLFKIVSILVYVISNPSIMLKNIIDLYIVRYFCTITYNYTVHENSN